MRPKPAPGTPSAWAWLAGNSGVKTEKGLIGYRSREATVTWTTNQARYTLWFAKQINSEELPPFSETQSTVVIV